MSNVFNDAIVWIVILATMVILAISLLYLRSRKYVYSTKFAEFLLIFYMGFVGLVSLFAILSDVYGEISCGLKAWFL